MDACLYRDVMDMLHESPAYKARCQALGNHLKLHGSLTEEHRVALVEMMVDFLEWTESRAYRLGRLSPMLEAD